MTELGDAELTDQQMMSLSDHKRRETLTVYSKVTQQQAQRAARKRIAWRAAGQKSE